MGYIRHNAIIVTTFSNDLAQEVYKVAKGIFQGFIKMNRPVKSPVNGYFSIFIPPDGSKEGWDASDNGDSRRHLLRQWLVSKLESDTSSVYDWVEVQYGDDNGVAMIIDSDTNYYVEEKEEPDGDN